MVKLFAGLPERIAKSTPTTGLPDRTILSDIYASLLAYNASGALDRWGIVEVDSDMFRLGRRYQTTLKKTGFYQPISPAGADAVSRIFIYDPKSNPFITRLILHATMGHNRRVMEGVHRWLTGSLVAPEDVVCDNILSKAVVKEALTHRNGLDLFYSAR